jgi:hypothetical protein
MIRAVSNYAILTVLRIRDVFPGSRSQKDTGSRIRIRNTVLSLTKPECTKITKLKIILILNW